jgi:hypothetical protein
MDQVSFEFIRVALIERVKENPIYCSWRVSIEERDFRHDHPDIANQKVVPGSAYDPVRRTVRLNKYGFVIATNVGRGFGLYCVSESAITSIFKTPITQTPFSGSVPDLGLCEGPLREESIIALHQWLQQVPA